MEMIYELDVCDYKLVVLPNIKMMKEKCPAGIQFLILK